MTWDDPLMYEWVHAVAPYAAQACACQFDKDWAKAWMFVSNRPAISHLARSCPHPAGTHEPIVGVRLPDGTFKSRITAKYPALLAQALDPSWRRVTRCYRWMTGSPSCRNNCLGQIHQVESRTEVVCRAQHSTCNRNDTTRWWHCAQDGSGVLAIADSASKLLLHYCQAAKSHLSLRTSSNHTWKTCSRFWIAHQVTFSWTFHLANPFVWSCGIVWQHSCTTLTLISFFSSLQECVWVSMSHWLRLRHGHNIQVCYPRRCHFRIVATAGKAPKIIPRLFDLSFKRSLMAGFIAHVSGGIPQLKQMYSKTAIGKLGVVPCTRPLASPGCWQLHQHGHCQYCSTQPYAFATNIRCHPMCPRQHGEPTDDTTHSGCGESSSQNFGSSWRRWPPLLSCEWGTIQMHHSQLWCSCKRLVLGAIGGHNGVVLPFTIGSWACSLAVCWWPSRLVGQGLVPFVGIFACGSTADFGGAHVLA